MKKLLLAGNLLFCSLFILSKCNDKLKPLSANCSPCKDYSQYPRFNFLNAVMLDSMSKLYKSVQAAHAVKTQFNDATSIWFNLDTIKRFIWEIENAVCKKNCMNNNDNPNLGIRIYYARYPEKMGNQNPMFSQIAGLDARFEKMHTLFMIPTYDKLNGTLIEHTDFDPYHTFKNKNNICEYTSLTELSNVGASITAMAASARVQPAPIPGSGNNTNATTGQNHGSLCPPLNCEGSAFK